MIISISDLQKIVVAVLGRYLEINKEEITTRQDNFWYVNMEEAINFTKVPVTMSVGSLENDYNSLKEILTSERQANILDVDRIANILRIVSYEIENQNDRYL